MQTMTRLYVFSAHSSLPTYLSCSSSVLSKSRWNELYFVRLVIDYVKNKRQRKYEQSLHQCTNRIILPLLNVERCFNNSVFIKITQFFCRKTKETDIFFVAFLSGLFI